MTTDNDRGDTTPGVSETNTDRSRRSRSNKRRNNKQTTTAFKGDCSDLKGHTFVWSKIKTKKWIKSKEAFLDYVGTKYGDDEKASLKLRTPTIIGMDKPTKPTKTEYDNWGAMEREDYKMDNKEYRTAELILKRHLMKLHNILWKQCDLQMQNKIASQKEFEQQDAKADVLMLMELIDPLCEGGGETKCWRLQKIMAQKR